MLFSAKMAQNMTLASRQLQVTMIDIGARIKAMSDINRLHARDFHY